MNKPTTTRVTNAGMVFDAAPTKRHLQGPQVVPGSKPCDILKRKPGQCAAVVRSKGLVHYVCALPVSPRIPGYDYCPTHDPFDPQATGSQRELIRGLRRHMEK